MAVNMLIVDDSFPMRSVIKKTIKASGYATANIYTAENGIEALEVLKNEWCDIVLTDFNMPEMDGMELLSAIKKDKEISAIPVLIITTEGSEKRVAEFMEKGASGYVKKPFTPEVIRQKLIDILGDIAHEDNFEESDDGLDF